MLYSELTIIVELGDILCLGGGNYTRMERKKKIWRHNPLYGIGHRDGEHGKHVYDTPKLDGRIEPHVFAKFQRIDFDADLVFSALETRQYINDNLDIIINDQVSFDATLRGFNLLAFFMRIIRNSPYLRLLTIELNVCVEANHDASPRIMENYAEKRMALARARNQQAVETLMDNGLLDPLRDMSNIQSLNFILSEMFSGDGHYQMQPRHIEMIRCLQHDMKCNWLLKQNPVQDAGQG